MIEIPSCSKCEINRTTCNRSLFVTLFEQQIPAVLSHLLININSYRQTSVINRCDIAWWYTEAHVLNINIKEFREWISRHQLHTNILYFRGFISAPKESFHIKTETRGTLFNCSKFKLRLAEERNIAHGISSDINFLLARNYLK